MSWVARKLRREMNSCAANREYEKAAGLRELLRFCGEFSSRQLFTQRFKAGPMTIHDQGSQPLTYRFMRGNLVGISPVNGDETACGAVPEELLDTQTDARLVLDRAILVYGWLNRNAGNCKFTFSMSPPPVHSTGSSTPTRTRPRAPERSPRK